ncbi:hypothetical protein ACP70R_045807 [Stipagrostis hirtigluma subsp. patula]
MEAEPQRWAATYTKHVKQKRKAYHDGALLLYPASGRLVLLDDAGDTLESKFLRASEEVSTGAALSFQAYLVDVGEPEACSAGPRSSSAPAAASRTAHRGGARARPPSAGRFNPRAPRAFVNPAKSRGGEGGGRGGEGDAVGSGGGEVVDSRFQEWTALYTTQLTQKAKKFHDGVVRLVQVGPHAKQIVLLDEDGQVLGSRHLKSGESVESGKKCIFPNYLIEICEARNQRNGLDNNSSEEAVVHTRPKSGENTSNKVVLGSMSKSQKFISPQKNHEDFTSEVTASSDKSETGKVDVVVAGSSGSLVETDLDFKEWNALYTTHLTQKAKKFHDGIIRLMQVGSHARQIVLLDEDGGVLGTRYLKSVESIKSGMNCQIPNYLIEVCELRSQKNEANSSSKEALSQIGRKGGENTSDKGEKSKSPKFVSPFKFQDVRKSTWGSTASSNRAQMGKTTCSNLDGQKNFHVLPELRRGIPDCDVDTREDHGKTTFDIQRGTSNNSNWHEVGKSSSSRVGDPLQFNDLQHAKSGCPTNFIRREVGRSTFGNMDDSLRTASQILSIMRPPSEFKNSQRAPSEQARSLASSESRIAFDASCRKNSKVDDSNRTSDGSGSSGLSHFASHLRTSVQSCLNLETLQPKSSVRTHHWDEPAGNSRPTYDHQPIMRPAVFQSQDSAMVDTLASDISNAEEQKLDSSNHRTGSSTDTMPVTDATTNPGLQEEKSGIADKLITQNSMVDGKCDGPPSNSAYTLTCKDPKIQKLIDDCPSFDLGF